METKEKFERAKRLYETANADQKYVLESLFPELAESEDERIRKDLITFLDDVWHLGKDANFDKWGKADCSDWITWIEKQGEQKAINREIKPRTYSDFYKRLTESEREYIQEYVDHVIEKTKELYKQGEQKSADKVEPMFKEGDWIIYKDEWTREEDVLVVSNPDPNGTSLYTTKGQQKYYLGWDSLKDAKLWTLEDAKRGDILYDNSTDTIFIFEGLYNGVIEMFCDCCEGIFSSNNVGGKISEMHISPVTKEQRDTLMKAMTDAGYEWDAKKKELKKIEQKPAEQCDISKEFSEAVSEKIRNMVSRLFNGDGNITSKEFADQFSCELLTLARYEIQKEQNSAWSEEGETMLKRVIGFIPQCMTSHGYNEYINWLKSLKERYTWKPSNEQMEYLTKAITTLGNEGDNKTSAILYELRTDLKKLKG